MYFRVLPSPSWPCQALPQHTIAPTTVSPQVCTDPALTALRDSVARRAFTTTVPESRAPRTVTQSWARPGLRAVTTPVALTVTTVVSVLFHSATMPDGQSKYSDGLSYVRVPSRTTTPTSVVSPTARTRLVARIVTTPPISVVPASDSPALLQQPATAASQRATVLTVSRRVREGFDLRNRATDNGCLRSRKDSVSTTAQSNPVEAINVPTEAPILSVDGLSIGAASLLFQAQYTIRSEFPSDSIAPYDAHTSPGTIH